MGDAARPRREPVVERLSVALKSSRLGRRLERGIAEARTRAIPVHWSNLFGVGAVACLVVIFFTGVYLMFAYEPSSTPVHYTGSYPPLEGAEVSAAYASTLAISFDLPGGLLMRQAHHWAALLLPGTVILQMLVSFFTGAFRRPRRGSWVLLFLIFVMALAAGWSGYGLPDDMLSGTGLRIVEGISLGIPFIGTWLSGLLFGGGFPGRIIEHLYPLHVAVFPVLLLIFLVLRLWSSYRRRPPQFAGPGRTPDNVVGLPLLPQVAVRASGLFFVIVGLLIGISATVTVAPIWIYGPADPGNASAGSQPDWYTGFLDGALRLVPPGWEFVWLDRTWTLAVIIPLIVVGVFLLLVVIHPFLEEWVTGDHREHHILDRPRNAPGRTAIGVAGMVFYGTLWGAGSTDLIATHFEVGLDATIHFFQISAIVGPVIAFEITRRIAIGLERKDRQLLLHGVETGRIVRLPGGEYIEVHAPLSPDERWRLISEEEALQRPVSDAGPRTLPDRIRSALSRMFFEHRLEPLQADELAALTAPSAAGHATAPNAAGHAKDSDAAGSVEASEASEASAAGGAVEAPEAP